MATVCGNDPDWATIIGDWNEAQAVVNAAYKEWIAEATPIVAESRETIKDCCLNLLIPIFNVLSEENRHQRILYEQ